MKNAWMQKILQAWNLKANFCDIFIRPSHNDHTACIDGLRAFSVLYVILYHCIIIVAMVTPDTLADVLASVNATNQWVLMGDRGVDSFFVISGFLIASILFKEHQQLGKIRLGRFYYRRLLRLSPAYLLLIYLFSLFAISSVQKEYLVAYVFYLNNFLDEPYRYISHAWSLAVEEQFYLVFGVFTALVFFRVQTQYRLLLLLVLYCLSLVFRFIPLWQQPELLTTGHALVHGKAELTAAYNQALYINLHTRFGGLLTGVIAAFAVVFYPEKLKQWLQKYGAMLFLVAVALLVITDVLPVYKEQKPHVAFLWFYHIAHRHIFAFVIVVFLLLAFCQQGLAGKCLNRFLSLKLWFPISQLSYSLYLFHLAVLLLFANHLYKTAIITSVTWENIWLLFVYSLPLLLLTSSLIYIFIERPFMKLR